MKVKTAELTGRALDWAVAQSGGDGTLEFWSNPDWSPSTKWEHGGPIIEREQIALFLKGKDIWKATDGYVDAEGDTLLIAAMRCFVASKLGDEVDVPGGLQ